MTRHDVAFPLACPSCGEDLHRRRQPPWRYSIRSYALFLAGGVLGYFGFWLSGLRGWSYAWLMAPVSACAYLGFRLPRVRVLHCSSCGESRRVYSKPQRTASEG
jgi:hypothetical protein